MDIQLKNIHLAEKKNDSSMWFQAALFINGNAVGAVINCGPKGTLDIFPFDHGISMIREANTWCRSFTTMRCIELVTQRKRRFSSMYLEIYIENIIIDWLTETCLTRYCQNMEKEMEMAILFGVPSVTVRIMKYKQPMDVFVSYTKGMEKLRMEINQLVLPERAVGRTILN